MVEDHSEETKELGFDRSLIGKPKPFTKFVSKWAKLTEWVEITIYELFLILQEEKKQNKEIDEEEICPICRCELYDDIMTLSKEELLEKQQEMLGDHDLITVIKFGKCAGHYYHKDCADMLLGDKDSFKCPVTSRIYGVLIGEMPSGRMSWCLIEPGQYSCAGYECSGTWQISYSFYDGYKPDGTPYHGTRRVAFLPDVSDGREVLFLLIKCFKRRHTFAVGDSVTTGRKNVVVWNAVHHKTNITGGTSHFGWPDPTYFNRVKLELADKGVVMEEGDDPSTIQEEGYIQINVK